MAISVDWPNKIINVSLSELTLISGDLYTLDLNSFRLTLKNLEDGPGIPFLDTHRHVTTSTLGGVTFARVIEIINGYTVTFEDGQYAVDLVGANSNIPDVTNVNQVSIRSANSAGLVQVTTGSGLSTEQSTQLTQLHAALESAGVFSTGALANGSGLSLQQSVELSSILTRVNTLPILDDMEGSEQLTAIADLSGVNTSLTTIQTALDSVAIDAKAAKNLSAAGL